MEQKYELYLKDMLEAVNSILEYTEGMSFEEFEDSRMEKDAALRNFQKLGEAAGEIPEEYRKENTQISWQDIKDFRNVIIHQYWKIDEEIAWEIIQEKLPELKQKLEKRAEQR